MTISTANYQKSMVSSRVRTFVGFAIKKRATVVGVDNLTSSKNKLTKVILIDENLSERSAEKVIRFAQSKDIDIFRVDMNEILIDSTCKAIGITDSGLATAVINEIKES